MRNRFSIFLLFCLWFCVKLNAQEALLSAEETYYDFLSLQGLAERPYLNYRTLSDSVWGVDEPHLWQWQNLGTKRNIFGNVFLRVYGPELFSSYNTAAPYGQNDGALWQGRGLNGSLTSGIRLEGYGAEFTFKPVLAFSQNLEFDYIQPRYSGTNYAGKADEFGYYGITYIDAPQRFGDGQFFTFDWGDSEIRYTWKTLTAGFGTQTVWLGPAELNPIIHSNNAPSYPKIDIGLRRQPMTLPWLGWHIGDIEFRTWWGYLSESDWFDNNASNDHNLITGLSVAYSFPSLLSGLTIGLNRVMLSKWEARNYRAFFTLINPFIINFVNDENDQLASLVFNYHLPKAGINIYYEFGREDFSPDIDSYLRYPFHTMAYTAGMKKTLPVSGILTGEILLEVTGLEGSREYDRLIPFGYTFYTHSVIRQGYTNRGQHLGAGVGGGGNSQYLGFRLYFPRGYGGLFIQRRNPDMDYTWYIDSKQNSGSIAEINIRMFLDYGISGLFYFLPGLSVSGSFVFRDEHNPLGKFDPLTYRSSHRYNFHLAAAVKYSF